MRTIRFYKEIDEWYGERWYADVPEWEGEKADLEMVCGADTMLGIFAGCNSEVFLTVSDVYFEGHTVKLQLMRAGKEEGGGYYFLQSYQGIDYNMEIWLCDVTKFIFSHLPEVIYLKRCLVNA